MIQGVDKYLTQDVSIYTMAEGVDTYGGITLTPTIKATVKGRMRKLSGNERYISEKNSEEVNYRLYLRPTEIEVTDEIKYNNEYYLIESINDVMEFAEFYHVDLRKVV